jgi:membrane-bound ClpP family serine protease
MQVFQLVLQNERKQAYGWISYLLLLLNIVSFVFLSFGNSKNWMLAPAIALIILLLLKLFGKKFNPKNLFSIAFLISAISWAVSRFYIFAMLQLLFMLLEWYSRQKRMIIVSSGKISTRFLFKKTIEWSELTNVILKDGFLTIDFKNNKLLQAEIDGESGEIDETLFNRFCLENLEANK